MNDRDGWKKKMRRSEVPKKKKKVSPVKAIVIQIRKRNQSEMWDLWLFQLRQKDCRYQNYECNSYGEKGYLSIVCKNSKKDKNNTKHNIHFSL